jgi:hypothetical protein
MLSVLLALEHFTGNNRSCWPRIRRDPRKPGKSLEEQSGMKHRAIIRTLAWLRAQGLIEAQLRNSGRGRISSRYLFCWAALEAIAPAKTGAANPAGEPAFPSAPGTPGDDGAQVPLGHRPSAPGTPPSAPGAPLLTPPLNSPKIPPPPVTASPINRIAAVEGAVGAAAFWEGLKAEDLLTLDELLAAFGRLSGEGAALEGVETRRFVALCRGTRRDARSKAGTPEAFRDWVQVLNWRLRQPVVKWQAWITRDDQEGTDRDLSKHAETKAPAAKAEAANAGEGAKR